ncbi:MAG: AtpZ/AtpI family protein [Ardenticatenales bacterium]|jgi:F0F1-type ATP synthase assembly protein I|nr:AtpZ/AtpI family protein [Ardenticatenales bacterium]
MTNGQVALLASQLAWTLAFMVLIPAGVGVLIDRRFGTAPWAILVGALAGIIFATIGITRRVLRHYEALAPREPRPDGDGVAEEGPEEDSEWAG